MRFGSIFAAATAVGSVAGAGLCSKYTTALLKDDTPANQLTVLALLVKTAVIGPFTGKGTPNPTLPGNMADVSPILAPGTYMGTKVDLVGYFNGSMMTTNIGGKAGSKNFLQGYSNKFKTDPTYSGPEGSNVYVLLTHLYSYFGLLLGCDVGKGAYPAYGGVTSQYEVHKFMKLDEAEFGYFVQAVGGAAASFGVTAADIKTVANALTLHFGERCAPAEAIVPMAKAELQAICIANDCPKAKMATCAAYQSGGGGGGGSPDAAGQFTVSKALTGAVGFVLAAFSFL